MKLAYVGYDNAFVLGGVMRKIQTQVQIWRSRGHGVELFLASRAPADPSTAPALDGHVFTFTSPVGRVESTLAVARAVRRFAPDLVYLRADRFLPPLPPLLWPLPVVLEVNSGDREEARLYGPATRAYNEVQRLGTLPFAAGFVCVTRELKRTLGRATAPVAVIANGVESRPSTGTPVAPTVAASPPRAVMLVGATPPAIWNGIDKFPSLLQGFPELAVDLIGPSGDSLPHLPDGVTVHGMLSRDEYLPLLERADFALGPLALHRKSMHEACPLKVREYLINGLPVVMAYDDTDFPGAAPWYVMELPNDESNVKNHASEVRSWWHGLNGRRVDPVDMQRRVGAEEKERERLSFFAHVLAERSEKPGLRRRVAGLRPRWRG